VSETAPTVSVVLRTYQHARFIAQAIDSVLIQRAPFAYELIVAEDCSTDGTRQIVAGYAERHRDTIGTVLPRRNVGHGEILRRGLAQARGELIAYLDGDDYWTSPLKLARQADFLARNPDCASCFHDVSLVYDDAGAPSGTVSPGLAGDRFTLEQIVMECFVPAPSMMFRREVLRALPAWSFDSAWIDWLIHIRSAQLGLLGYLPQAMAAYRVHPGGMFSGLDRAQQLQEDVTFYERLAPELPEQRELIERCVAYRRAQLAVERLGVPFSSCVVLVDPRREARPYFNGRHARALPRREGHEVSELHAIREASCALPLATRDYGTNGRASEGESGCYVVVPGWAAGWVRQRPQLRRYLQEHGEVVCRDEWVVVHRMRPPAQADGRIAPRGACRVEVRALTAPAELAGANVEAPASGELVPVHAIALVGWVLGGERQVEAIELECAGELVWRAPVHLARPDVQAAFPDHPAASPGFATTYNAEGSPAGTVTSVVAVLRDGARAPFAELRLRDPREEAAAP
jgi:Glycosyl transferase family 2